MSVKQYILENSTYIKGVTGVLEAGWAKLEANDVLSSGTNKDRMVLFPADPMVVERHVEVTKMAPLNTRKFAA